MSLTLLKGGRVVDPANRRDGTFDLLIDGDRIASVGRDLAAPSGVTIIEDDVKIGSDTMLVAPVRVGKGSVTAAGSVVTKDVPPNTLVAGVPAVVKKKLKEKESDE